MTDPTGTGGEAPFAVGEWWIDPSRRIASRGDTVSRLSPRSMNVLLFLADRAGQVVSRDDLIAQFWKGSESSENAVRKVMVELRQAFSQADDNTTYIETIPRRGYRLAVPVRGRGTDRTMGVPRDATPGVIGNAARQAEPAASGAALRFTGGSATQTSAWRLYLTIAFVAAVIASVVAMVLGTILLEPPKPIVSASSEPQVGGRTTIRVLPTLTLGEGSDADRIATRLTHSLRSAIGELQGVSLVDPSRDDGTSAGSPAENAKSPGAALVLESSVQQIGDHVRANVTVSREHDDATLYTSQLERPNDAAGELTELMAGNLLSAIAIIGDEKRVAEMWADGTRNVAAYLAAQEGDALHWRHGPRSMEFAAQRFRDAIAIDPNFGKAYGDLASTLDDIGTITLDSSKRQELRAEIGRLNETLLPAQRERLERQTPNAVWIAHWQLISSSPRDLEWKFRLRPVLTIYAALLASAHLDSEANDLLNQFQPSRNGPWQTFRQLDVASWTKEPHRAIAAQRQILGSYPEAVDVLCNLAANLAFTGQFDESERYLDRLSEADPAGRWAHLAQLIVAELRGELNDATARERALADPRTTDYARGVVSFIHGDLDAGYAAWARVDVDAMQPLVLRSVAFEKLFSAQVRTDERYQSALEALGIGASWTQYMRQMWPEFEQRVRSSQ